MNTVSRYFSMVKFSHTVFAMPFALTGYVYGLVSTGTPFQWQLLVKIILAMVFARNAAMGFNRYLDRGIDARNARTAGREIPSGKISPRSALLFVIINCLLFTATAYLINPLAFYLSPVVLVVLLGYSYTKRFTSWCHLVLGLALAMAPAGAYIAVTGELSLTVMILSALVLTWVAGFDIIYSLQDIEFDREEGLRSIPAKLGVKGSLALSAGLHILTVCTLWLTGLKMGAGKWYWIGATIFVVILVCQHIAARPSRIDRMGAGFGTVNGLASLCFAAFAITDMLGCVTAKLNI